MSEEPSSFTLKIRGGGCEVDSHGNKAGKGPLVQTELSGTLGVSQDQTLIHKANGVTFSDIAATRQADDDPKGFHSQAMREPEQNVVLEPVISVDMGAGKSSCGIHFDKTPTLATTHQGEPVIVDEEPIVSSKATHFCHYNNNGKSETLVATDYKEAQLICYGISPYGSNSMLPDNPHSGIYEAETSRTIDVNGGNPNCNQGGMIVLEGNGQRESHRGDGYKESDTMYTLNTVEQHGVCYGLDRASFNQGQNAKYDFSVDEELSPPIVARGPGGVMSSVHSRQETIKEQETNMSTKEKSLSNSMTVLNDQGGQQMSVTSEKTSTLRSQEHGHQPIVIENRPNASQVKFAEDNIFQTLCAKMGTGGGIHQW